MERDSDVWTVEGRWFYHPGAGTVKSLDAWLYTEWDLIRLLGYFGPGRNRLLAFYLESLSYR